MDDIYADTMEISREYMTIHRYIISNKLGNKDCAGAIDKLSQIKIDMERLEKSLSRQPDSNDSAVFEDHLRNLGWMVSGLLEITQGLEAKANSTGKYGIFKYRKGLKVLNDTHKLFEISGNYTNSCAPRYL